MDCTRLTILNASVNSQIEPIPLLLEALDRQRYQAYCVTEASSRAQSPDPLIPQLLLESTRHPQDIESDARIQYSHRASTNALLIPSPASNPAKDVTLEVPPKAENICKRQLLLANRTYSFGNAITANSNHITQAVAPRGNYLLLAPIDRTTCDTVLSHPRVRHGDEPHATTLQTTRRKPVRRYQEDAWVDFRPLSSCTQGSTTETGTGDSSLQRQDHATDWHVIEHIFQAVPSPDPDKPKDLSDVLILRNQSSESCDLRPSTIAPCDYSHQKIPRRSEAFEERPKSPSLTVSFYDTSFQDNSNTSRNSNHIEDHAQFPSSTDLYTSRDHLLKPSDERRALRRTKPKDARFRYKFGQLPPCDHDNHPSTPPHHSQALTYYPPYPAPTPSLHSAHDPASGPRPPPWGSYEDLEMQRRQRSNARGRAEAQRFRKKLDSVTSSRRESQSTVSVGRGLMRREVEEYREAVLNLYPDLEFDVDVGMEERGCRWCVVM